MRKYWIKIALGLAMASIVVLAYLAFTPPPTLSIDGLINGDVNQARLMKAGRELKCLAITREMAGKAQVIGLWRISECRDIPLKIGEMFQLEDFPMSPVIVPVANSSEVLGYWVGYGNGDMRGVINYLALLNERNQRDSVRRK